MAPTSPLPSSLGGISTMLGPIAVVATVATVATATGSTSSSRTCFNFNERHHVRNILANDLLEWRTIEAMGRDDVQANTRYIQHSAQWASKRGIGVEDGISELKAILRGNNRRFRGWSWIAVRGGSASVALTSGGETDPVEEGIGNPPRDVKVLVSTTKISSYVDAVSGDVLHSTLLMLNIMRQVSYI